MKNNKAWLFIGLSLSLLLSACASAGAGSSDVSSDVSSSSSASSQASSSEADSSEAASSDASSASSESSEQSSSSSEQEAPVKVKVSKYYDVTGAEVACSLKEGDELTAGESQTVTFTYQYMSAVYTDYVAQVGDQYVAATLSSTDSTVAQVTFTVPEVDFVFGLACAGSASSLITVNYEEGSYASIYGLRQGQKYDGGDTFIVEVDEGCTLKEVYYTVSGDESHHALSAYSSDPSIYVLPSSITAATSITIHVDAERIAAVTYAGNEQVITEESSLPTSLSAGAEANLYYSLNAGYAIDKVTISYDDGSGASQSLEATINGFEATFTVPDSSAITVTLTTKSAAPIAISGSNIASWAAYSDLEMTRRVRSVDPKAMTSFYLSLTPAEGYLIDSVSVSSSQGYVYQSSMLVSVSSSWSGATFTVDVVTARAYSLTVSEFAGGSIALPQDAYKEGASVSLEAIFSDNARKITSVTDSAHPDLAITFAFKEVDEEGKASWSIAFTMPAYDVNLVVTVEEKVFTTLTPNVNDMTPITGSGYYYSVLDSYGGWVNANEDYTYTVVLGEAYTFAISYSKDYTLEVSITEDGATTEVTPTSSEDGYASYSLTFSKANPILNITFTAIPKSMVTLENPDNIAGYFRVNGEYIYFGGDNEVVPIRMAYGATFVLTIQGAEVGYKVNAAMDGVALSSNNNTTSTRPSFTGTAPEKDCTISITREKVEQRTITVTNSIDGYTPSIRLQDWFGSTSSTVSSKAVSDTTFTAYDGALVYVSRGTLASIKVDITSGTETYSWTLDAETAQKTFYVAGETTIAISAAA